MSKSGITNTLQESLILQQELSLTAKLMFEEEDEKKKEQLEKQFNQIKKRIYKLPNYNMTGLEKLMKFYKPYTEGSGYAEKIPRV